VIERSMITGDNPLGESGDLTWADKETPVQRLAHFFPGATPVHLRVQVSGEAGASESTVIEFGTSCEVLFASGLPLEFGEQVHLRNADRSLDAEAFVVALRVQPNQMVVAARFAHEVANWIIKP
jgi:hypothetical protein